MKCCVQNCLNDDDEKELNKIHGIRFHKLPTSPDHYAAWLKVLGIPSGQLSSNTVVCSKHFEAKDFYETLSNEIRVNTGAVPTEVCRVCLALNVKMYDLKDLKFSEMFHNITGILTDKDSTLHHVCWECAARLSAAAAFRDKALLSDALLKDVQLNDIAAIKDTYSFLKSSLAIQRVFITCAIECEDANDTLVNVVKNTDKNLRKTKTTINQEENYSPEHEPWIYVPIKVEIEPDPIADNSIPKEEIDDTFLEETHSHDEDIEEQVDNSNTITKETKMSTDPMVNDDDDIDLADHEKEKPKLDVIVDNVDESGESSSGEDAECEVSIHEIKKITTNKVGIVKRKFKTSINDSIKEKIIELKKNGAPTVEIAKKTGASIASINSFWQRYCKDGTYHKSGTGQSQDKKTNTEPAKGGEELKASTPTVRRRLAETGLKHVSMTRPVIPSETSNRGVLLNDDLKQRIITLKQEGVPTKRVVRLLNVTRKTVLRWWARWNNEGHLNNLKKPGMKKSTTPQQEQRIIERVMKEPRIHTPSLAKEIGVSTQCVRHRLKEAGFKIKQKKAIVPLRSGRCHKVADDTKQQIISMKQNGVPVTDIANQFRVTRTSVYRWWRLWCKENKTKLTSIRTNTSTKEDQSLTEDSDVRNSTQAPTVKSNFISEWQKLPDVEFVS